MAAALAKSIISQLKIGTAIKTNDVDSIKEALIQFYIDVFKSDSAGVQPTLQPMRVGRPMQIKLRDGATPYPLSTTRMIPFPLVDAAKAELEKMWAKDIITPQDGLTSWLSLIHI